MSIPEELVSLIDSQPAPRVLKRALAVKMTLQGFTHQQIMGAIQVCSGFISKWKQIYLTRVSKVSTLGIKVLSYISALKIGQRLLPGFRKPMALLNLDCCTGFDEGERVDTYPTG